MSFLQNLTRPFIILIIFFITGSVVFSNSIDNPFELDDGHSVEDNINIRRLSNIPRFFIDPALSVDEPSAAGHYRPFVVTSYAISYAISGLKPWGYHMINLAFHIGAAFIVFLIIKAILNENPSPWFPPLQGEGKACPFDSAQDRPERSRRSGDGLFAALTAGLIFMVHPFNAEAVNYITAHSSVLSGFFYLLTFYCWVKYRKQNQEILHSRQNHYYIASILAFTLGILSKEVLITLPFMIWLYDLYMKGFKWSLSLRNYAVYLPFIAVSVFYLLLRNYFFGGAMPDFQRDTVTQLFTVLPALVKYWQMFIWPAGLTLVHYTEISRQLTFPVIVAILLLLSYIVVAIYFAWWNRSFYRTISFFMLWFLIVLLPTIIIPLHLVFQENRGYLAIVSFVVIIGLSFGRIEKHIPSGKLIYGLIAACIFLLLGAYTITTVYRNGVWGDSISLWKDAVLKSPRSALAYAGLADAYNAREDYFLALETARKGLESEPDNFFLRVHLGLANTHIGNIDEAISEYEKALQINDEQVYVWMNLALLYKQRNDLDKALYSINQAVRIKGDYPPFYYHMGRVYAAGGMQGEAVGAFQKSIALYPEYLLARYELAEILDKTGRHEKAREQYDTIVKLGMIEDIASHLLFDQDYEKVKRIIEESGRRSGG